MGLSAARPFIINYYTTIKVSYDYLTRPCNKLSSIYLMPKVPNHHHAMYIVRRDCTQDEELHLKSMIVSFSKYCHVSGDLIHQLNRILFSQQFVRVRSWEVSLFLTIRFLYRLVTHLHLSGLCQNIDVQCVKYFSRCVLQDFCNYETKHVLAKVQQEFIGIWMSLIL